MASIVEVIVRTIDESTGMNGTIIGSFTELQSIIKTGKQVFEALQNVYEGTVGKAVELASAVRQVSLVSGMSTEASSRLLDVTEKLNVSQGALQTAMRFMAKNGIEPSFESLAKLSDEYIRLKDPVQQDQFLLDNFGRSGLNMAFMMSQGSEKLRQMNDEVRASLILTQQQVDAAHRNEIAVKELHEAWDAFTITLGNAALPVLTTNFEILNDMALAVERNGISFRNLGDVVEGRIQKGLERQHEDLIKNQQALTDHADALNGDTSSLKDNAIATEAIAGNVRTLSETYADQLSMLQSMQSMEISYGNKSLSLTNDLIKLQKEKSLKLAQGYAEEGKTIQDLNAKIQENSDASAENERQHDLDTKRIVLGYLQQQLAADGLTTAEIGFLVRKGKEWGLYSEKVVQDTADAEAEVKKYIDVLGQIPDHIKTTLELYTQYGDETRLVGGGAKRAMGGWASGRTKVGEFGPETVDLPPGSYVHPTADSFGMDNGKRELNLNVNISGGFTDPQSAARTLVPVFKYLLRQEGLVS